MVRKLRLFGVLFLLPWILIAAVGPRFATASSLAAAGPQKFTVLVGHNITTDNGSKPNWEGQNFYPTTLTINAGDSITWKHNSTLEPHTVTFLGPEKTVPDTVIPDPSAGPPTAGPPTLMLNPKVQLPAGGPTYDGSAFTSSGFQESDIPGPQDFTLTFSKPGTYPYVCALHAFNSPDGTIQGMKGTVIVQAAGSNYPLTPDQVSAETQKLYDADVAKAKSDDAAVAGMAAGMKAKAMPDGSMQYQDIVGYMDMSSNLEYQRFIPGEISLHAGDSVQWTMPMPGFHNVSMGGEEELFTTVPQAGGPPKLVLNPKFAFPVGGSTFDGTSYVNSGPLAAPGSPPQAGPQSYSLTFTKEGTFEFHCSVHDALGMLGHVTVLAVGQTPGMPRTGAGSADDWMLPAAAGSILLALSGVAMVLRRRKSSGLA